MVFLIIGTALTVLFVILSLIGGKYDYMIEPLDDDPFPLKFLYSAGFALSDIGLFKLRGKVGRTLREETDLYYGRKYGEFYARAIWSQSLSMALFAAALMFSLAGLLGKDGALFALLGVVAAALAIYYFMTYTRSKLTTRRDECETEFPSAASKLALLVNAGVVLHEAWRMVAYGKEGTIYSMMQDACNQMDNGKSEIDAIYEFGVLSDSNDVKKFASALIQSIERGGGDLPGLLSNQSSELWEQRRQRLLQKGEAAASALLMPIVLMFSGVLMIVVVAAVQSMGF